MAQVEWGLLVAADLFLSGLGAGAYIVSAIADIKGGKKYEKMARFGSHLSWPLVLAGLFILVIHMGRPGLDDLNHIMNVFNNLPSSMLTVEALFSGGLIVLGAATSFLWLAKWKKTWLRTIMEIIGIAVASCLIASSGFVLALSRGRPLWGSYFLPWIYVISAVLAGLALIGLAETHLGSLLFPRFTTRPESAMLSSITKYTSMTIAVLLIAVTLYSVDVLVIEEAAIGLSSLTTGSMSVMFWSSIIIGLLAPIALRVAIAKRAKEPGTEMGIKLLSLVSFLCIMFGVFALRYAITIAGQL